jgi:hypothetical protein
MDKIKDYNPHSLVVGDHIILVDTTNLYSKAKNATGIIVEWDPVDGHNGTMAMCKINRTDMVGVDEWLSWRLVPCLVSKQDHLFVYGEQVNKGPNAL